MATFNGGTSQTAEASFTNPYDSILRNHAQNLFDGTMEALDNNRNTDKENRLTQRANITNDLLAQIQGGNLTDLGSLPIGNYDTTALVKALSDKAIREETERHHRASIATQRYGINTRAATQRYGIDRRISAAASRAAARTAADAKLLSQKQAAAIGLVDRQVDELARSIVGEGTKEQQAKAQQLADYRRALEAGDAHGIAQYGGDFVGPGSSSVASYNPKVAAEEIASKARADAIANSDFTNPKAVENYWSSDEGAKSALALQEALSTVNSTNRTIGGSYNQLYGTSTATKKATPKEAVKQIVKELKKTTVGSEEEKRLKAERKQFELAIEYEKLEKRHKGYGTNSPEGIALVNRYRSSI